MRFKNVKKGSIVAVGIFATSVLSLALAAPTMASQRTDNALTGPDAQSQSENQIATFLSSSPEPGPLDPEASPSEQNAHTAAMTAWWKQVPWDAVAGQWGCEMTSEEITTEPVDQNGVVVASHGGVMQCSELFTDAELAVIAQPTVRSEHEGIGSRSPSHCDFPGGDNYCINHSGSSMTASFQYGGSGNITGNARLGIVGVGASCGLGSQIAVGPVGIGSYGAVWYATGTINQSSQYSSSFMYSSTAVYGTWCALA